MASRAVRSARDWLITTGPIVVLALFCTWVLLAVRVIPVPDGDYGMFVTVAERLKAGDRLYADVYENKDPLFHYTLALTRVLTPYAGWILELMWILVASVAAYSISRRAGLIQRTGTLVGFVLTPLIVTGSPWGPGGSHLPGVALSLVITAAALGGRFWLAGALLGVLALFKIVMLPVALMIVLVVVVLNRSLRGVVEVLLSFAAVGGLLVGLMVLRHEFVPYLQSLRSSSVYANSAQSGGQGLAAVREHLTRVLTIGNQTILLTIVTITMLVIAIRPRIASTRDDDVGSVLAWSVLGTLATGLGVIAFTGLWHHHAQIFFVPAILALVLLMSRGPEALSRVTVISLAAALGFTFLLAGIPDPRTTLEALVYGKARVWEQTRVPDQTALILSTGPPTSFARVGGGNDGGFGRGLQDWDLACPRFGQSPLDAPQVLEATAACLPSANVIVVAPDAVPVEGAASWNAFIASVESLLADAYTCRSEETGRICVRSK